MRSSVSRGVAISVILIVLIIVAALGWKTIKGDTTEGKVTVDISKVKESMKTGRFGGH
ncbi:hypothetical protein LBMAG21_05460 [Armatimonadota bacterium]|nr:hypothetical protein LBMAG21_05460 [Armatimonadota bacterium]